MRFRFVHRRARRRERLAVGRHRLVGRPPLDVVGQRRHDGIAVLGPRCHRLKADRLQRRSIDGSSCRGGAKSPRSTCGGPRHPSPWNGALPVSRQ